MEQRLDVLHQLHSGRHVTGVLENFEAHAHLAAMTLACLRALLWFTLMSLYGENRFPGTTGLRSASIMLPKPHPHHCLIGTDFWPKLCSSGVEVRID